MDFLTQASRFFDRFYPFNSGDVIGATFRSVPMIIRLVIVVNCISRAESPALEGFIASATAPVVRVSGTLIAAPCRKETQGVAKGRDLAPPPKHLSF